SRSCETRSGSGTRRSAFGSATLEAVRGSAHRRPPPSRSWRPDSRRDGRSMRRAAFALAAVLLATSPAAAFGVGDVISDFLYYREALAADRAWPSPKGTLFLDAVYSRSDEDFEFGSVKTTSYGGQVGILYALHDRILVHGAFRGIGTDARFSFDDDFEYKFS